MTKDQKLKLLNLETDEFGWVDIVDKLAAQKGTTFEEAVKAWEVMRLKHVEAEQKRKNGRSLF
jgi:hypothetical protein